MAVNGDEGEPGTFKDRLLPQHRPAPLPRRHADRRPRGRGARTSTSTSATNIRSPARSCAREIAKLPPGGPRLHLRRGAGAYICGEESSLIESLEGKRGLPRHKPPFPFQVGLFGRPTLINNVETLFWVRDLIEKRRGVVEEPRRATAASGLRTYSVSGRVREPGVKLAPAGITVQELIDEYCGGMAEGHSFAAYLPGGASGGILPASMDDIPLDFGTLEKYGCFIGSAAVVDPLATRTTSRARRST